MSPIWEPDEVLFIWFISVLFIHIFLLLQWLALIPLYIYLISEELYLEGYPIVPFLLLESVPRVCLYQIMPICNTQLCVINGQAMAVAILIITEIMMTSMV